MIKSTDNFLKITDTFCDYVPFVSTATNFVDLAQKFIVMKLIEPAIRKSSRYYTHLHNKSAIRCIILLIPMIGNIVFVIYDFLNKKYNDKQFILHAIDTDFFFSF
jgi:hypothetical protein